MAELTDQTLRNINQRLNDMKKALDLSQTSVQQLGKALKEDLSPDQVNAFINALSKVGSGKANKVRLMMELVDDKGNVWNESTVKERIKDLSKAMETVQKGTKVKIGGVEYTNIERLTASLNNYRKMLEVLKMDSHTAFDYINNVVNEAERRRLEIERSWNQLENENIRQREKEKIAIEKESAKERIAAKEQEIKKIQQINKAWDDLEKKKGINTGDKLGDLAARRGLTGNLAALQDKSSVDIYIKEQALREKLSQKERDDFVLVEQKLRESAAKREKLQHQITADVEKEMKKRIDASEREAIAIRKREEEIQKEIRQRTLNEAKAAYIGIDKTQKELESQYISWINRRNKLLEKNASEEATLAVKRARGFDETVEDKALRERIERRREESNNLETKINNSRVQLSKDANQRIEQENSRHSDRMAEIAQQQAQRIQQIEQSRNKSQEELERSRNAQQRHEDAKARRASIEQQIKDYRRLEGQVKRYNDIVVRIRQAQEQRVKSGVIDEAKTQKEERLIRLLNQRVQELNKSLSNVSASLAADEKGVQALNRYKRLIGEIKNKTNETTASVDKLWTTVQRLASAFGVAFSIQGLAQFGKKLVETRGEFELQQVALRSILQNKQLADEIWDKTMQAALQSPFTAMQLTRYTKQLAAYRIENDKLFDTTKRLADVSAGLGVDMQRLILAYGQVKAANYLRASEIRQFTEAGVNILGELSKYLSDVKGEFVSTAQVMDMVQKRVVTFGAVEEVFKRLTDQGGIFYDMQYVQSQTVKGQINKLHDAYDQMLNSIGKANQGTIRDMVGLLNNIVKNWREWKTVLDAIAWPLIITSVYKFSRGLATSAASAVIATNRVNGLTKAGAKLQLMLKSMNLATVGWMGALTAVTAVIAALVNHTKAVKATQQALYEQNAGLFEQRNQLEKYKSTLEENNNALKNNSESEEKLRERRDENHSILTKLKNDYPQLAEGMEQMTDGTVKLTDALDKYNKALEDQMTLNYLLSQQSGGWLSDTVKDNLQAWETDMSQIKGELIAMQQAATVGMSRMFTEGKTGEPLYKLLEQIKNIDLSDIIKAREEYEKLYIQIYSLGEYKGSPTGIGVGKYVLPEYTEAFKFIEKFQHDEPTALEDFNKKTLPTIRRIFEENISSFSDYSKEISEKYDDSIVAFIAKNGKIINEGIKNGNKDVVKAIRTALQTAGIGLTEESRNFYNKIINEQIRFEAYQEVLAKQTDKSLKNRLKVMTQVYKDYQQIDFFAAPNTPDSTTPLEDKEGKAKIEVEKMISLLKEMHSEYDKLSKSAYGYAKSNYKVKESFQKAFDEVFKVKGGSGTYIDYNKIDITSKKGLANSLQMLYDELARTKSFAKFGKAFEQELLKAIASANTEVDLEMSVRIRDDFGRKMEEAFSGYELTLELQQLNIPEDAAKELFPDFEYTTLKDLQEIMDKFYRDRQKKDKEGNVLFSEDDLATYRKWADKVDAEILKLRKEKAKQYSKFLEKEYSDRAKLQMQHAKDVAFVMANVSDEKQRDNIVKGLNKKFESDLNELNWKSFKESDFYVEMMDDISSLPIEYTQMMLKKIEEILQHPEKLSPRALKEAINARQKVLEAQMELNPLKVMKESKDAINKAMQDEEVGGKNWKQTRKNLEEQITLQGETIAKYDEEISKLKDLQGELKGYEDKLMELRNAESSIDIKRINELLGLSGDKEISDISDINKSTVEQLQNKLKELKKDYDATEKSDLNNARAVEISKIEETIKLLNDELIARKAVDSYKMSSKAEAAAFTGVTSTDVGEEISTKEEEKGGVVKKQQTFKEWLKSFKTFDEALTKLNANINKTLNAVQGMGNAFYDMFDALGGETDALTEGWKEFGNTMISTITQTLTMIPMMVAAFTAAGTAINAALGIIGLIAEALQLLFTAIGAIAKLHDAHYEKEIEEQQDKIDDLKDAYERLETQINKTWDSLSYIETYNEQIDNIKEQIDALNAQIAAEEDKKNPDEDKIRDWKNSLNDAEDELDELAQKQKEVFGGIGEEGYRDAAQGFVDAWKQAFLDTGDGLQGLQDHFDEFLQDWFTKQATMLIARKYLDSMFSQIDAAVRENGNGGVEVMWDEIQKMMDTASEQFPEFSAKLEEFFNRFGGFGEGSLSGLAAGIQGMTEEQANILEAYWNSVRMYAANMDMNVSRIAEMLGIGGPNSNPMLTHLQTIANNTDYIPLIYNLLNRSVKNMGNGRGFITYQL